MPSSKLQPALFGGLVLGVLSALPVISIGNLCCCMWMIAGGVVAAYALQASQPEPVTTGDGAVVGLLAGVIGSGVYLLISVPVSILMGPVQGRMVERLLEGGAELPEAMGPVLEAMRHGNVSLAGIVVGFLVTLLLSLIFSTVGGVVGAALFRKKTPPFQDYGRPPDLPPPTYP
ncbi:MAG TPA: hypothetical protein VK911_17375 [Vicinamibacterales bacterium]|nr:hypothetical protein [Vicinamibacterales bacterium]